EIIQGSYRHKEPPEIQGTGYVIRSLEAALWAFHHSTSFENGALLAVNLGDDADTTGAVYGQIAGAYYGQSGIPGHWREKLSMKETIDELTEALWKKAEKSLNEG
uniref:ADP-ribosylglycohydrolase family protein n=1 Tax=Paenibacillus sp. 1-18 TaxID=1333846 RepID=UPI0018CC5088